MTAMEILVIILSVFLALFLLISIVLVALLIKVTQQIKRVTSSAERTAMNFEKVAGGIGKVTSPALLARIVMKQIKKRK